MLPGWPQVTTGMRSSEFSRRCGSWLTRPESCVAVAEGAEPVLVGSPGGESASTGARLSVDVVREAVFEAARKTMPNVAIGELDAFSEKFMEALRRSGDVSE